MPPENQESDRRAAGLARDIGELLGAVRASENRLLSLESATREGFRNIETKLSEHVREDNDRFRDDGQRLGALERWRSYILGALAILALLWAWYSGHKPPALPLG